MRRDKGGGSVCGCVCVGGLNKQTPDLNLVSLCCKISTFKEPHGQESLEEKVKRQHY